MAETETGSLEGRCCPLKTLIIICLSDPQLPAKFYLSLCNINTWTTQAINIMQSLMKPS